MKTISFSSFCELEVINLCGGERLGFPSDVEMELCDRRVISLTVRKCGSLFDGKEEYVIPWKCIECIGSDAILVKIEKCELEKYLSPVTGKRKFKLFV